MAGHSKWANIKHRKQAVDAKKSAKFHTLINEIRVAAATDNNPTTNFALRGIMQRARKINVPQHLIDRALNKKVAVNQSITLLYELHFAKQIALLVQINTTNARQLLPQLRHVIHKFPVELLPANSLQFLFQPVFAISCPTLTEALLWKLVEKFEVDKVIQHPHQTQFLFLERIIAKQAKAFLTLHQQIDLPITEFYRPFSRVQVSDEILEQYKLFCQKLTTTIATQALYDNLSIDSNPKWQKN